MVHKDNVYDGVHEAIIDQKLWDQVHDILTSNYRIKDEQAKMNTPALLKGLISTKDGRNLYPTFTRKQGKQYRYYLTSKASKQGYGHCDIKQIPAGEIEEIVVNQVHQVLKTPELIAKTLKASGQNGLNDDMINGLKAFEPVWMELFPGEQMRIIQLLINKVVVDVDSVDFFIRANGLASLAAEVDDQIVVPDSLEDDKVYQITVPIELRRRDGRKQIVIPDGHEYVAGQAPKPVTGLQKVLVQAFRWQGWLDDGKYSSARELGRAEGVDDSYVSKVLKYALLAPEIVEKIIMDENVDGLAARRVTGNIVLDWCEQRVVFG